MQIIESFIPNFRNGNTSMGFRSSPSAQCISLLIYSRKFLYI